MAKWGVFEVDYIHIAPCTEDGILLGGHQFQRGCSCYPRIEEQPNSSKVLVIHSWVN